MDRRESERLIEAVRAARAAGERVAMATVVRVRGSAYRREGTQMLVREDGSYECALSGSCLEPAIAEQALGVIATGEPLMLYYDLADDSLWGLGMGCSGAVDIRVERVEDDPVTREWLAILERGEPAVLATRLPVAPLSPSPLSASALSGTPLAGAPLSSTPTSATPRVATPGRVLVRLAGDTLGSMSDDELTATTIARARARLAAATPAAGIETIGTAEVFFEVSGPAPELIMFGAGHDAVPVARLAWSVGFAVTVVDVREAFLTPARFPDTTRILAHVSEYAGKVAIAPRSAVLIMNHHVERDRESLRVALDAGAGYVGVLGPRARYDKLVAALEAEGYRPPPGALARVRNPVGLALGAETPEEVAISILGEILANQRGFDGGFLTGTRDSLHDSRARARARELASRS